MSVQLPTGGVKSAQPRFLDRGGILHAQFGGADQRLDRLGSRWGCDFDLKPMKAEEARVWIARLIRGTREKALIKFPQPGLTQTFTAGNVLLNGNHPANVETIYLKSATASLAGKTFKEGQFFSVYRLGKRYLYQCTIDANWVAGGPGATVQINIQPPLRVTHGDNDPVDTNLSAVQIEGYVTGDKQSWQIDEAKVYGLSFSIEEDQ